MNQQKQHDDALTDIFGSEEMRNPAPTEFIPKGKTSPEIAYQLVKDETYPQTQPRLNLATFVTTYMDEYATRLMNEAIDVNYIDDDGEPNQVNAVTLPWAIEIVTNAPSMTGNVLAQGTGDFIGCRISSDDVIQVEKTSQQVSAYVYCLAKSV